MRALLSGPKRGLCDARQIQNEGWTKGKPRHRAEGCGGALPAPCEEREIGAMTDDECMAYDQSLRNAGRCLASEALQPVRTAATVRVRNGKVSVRDGPFTETKECLAGFYLIDAADLNDAIQVASQIPPARVGSIEVRPVRELTTTSGERRRT